MQSDTKKSKKNKNNNEKPDKSKIKRIKRPGVAMIADRIYIEVGGRYSKLLSDIAKGSTELLLTTVMEYKSISTVEAIFMDDVTESNIKMGSIIADKEKDIILAYTPEYLLPIIKDLSYEQKSMLRLPIITTFNMPVFYDASSLVFCISKAKEFLSNMYNIPDSLIMNETRTLSSFSLSIKKHSKAKIVYCFSASIYEHTMRLSSISYEEM